MSDAEVKTTDAVESIPTTVDNTKQVADMQSQIDTMSATIKAHEDTAAQATIIMPADNDELAKLQEQIEVLTKANETKPKVNNTPVSMSVANQTKAMEEATKKVMNRVTKVAAYNARFEPFIEKNKDLLPEDCQKIMGYYNPDNVSAEDIYSGCRSDLARSFFEQEDNLALLRDKTAVVKWLEGDPKVKDDDALDVVSEAFSTALHAKSLLAVAAQVQNANAVNNTDNDQAEQNLLKREVELSWAKDSTERAKLSKDMKQYLTNQVGA